MLPTFVIGLREGLEAALIVGIIAAFLGQQGRKDTLRQVWIGVTAAVVLCLAVGVVLQLVSQQLPQQGQEGLETVVGALAVVMVSYMILWMRGHAHGLKKELQGATANALAAGSTFALVAMAFLAVLREGFETVVFLLALTQSTSNPALATTGAILGIIVAAAIGYGIYRGGVRLNLGRFFIITGVVLCLVAAGLVMSTLHTAFEAGWLTVGQARAFDLSWLATPGTPLYSLFSGVLGIQPFPTVIEVIGWTVYLIPMVAIVLWPRPIKVSKTPAAVTAR